MKTFLLSLTIMYTFGIAQNCWSKDNELIIIDLDEKLKKVKSLDSLEKVEIKIFRKSINDSIVVIAPVIGTSTCVFVDSKDNTPVNNHKSRIKDNCTIQPEINLTNLQDNEYIIELASCYSGARIKIVIITK